MTQTTPPSSPGTAMTPAPQSSVWPPPSGTVIPFPLPWGGTGCCPPGGMSALMQCYCDIQQASAFIGQIMIDQINNNPAVAEAIIAAIGKSGSNVPLLGVTDGSDAQPGQVGEIVIFTGSVTYPATFVNPTPLTMGVLQPGDWDVWSIMQLSTFVTDVIWAFNPVPAGFSDSAQSTFAGTGGDPLSLRVPSVTVQASISVPTLINYAIQVNTTGTGGAGTATLWFYARRRR